MRNSTAVNKLIFPTGLALGVVMLADVVTSAKIIAAGGVEANPLMVHMAPRPGLFIAVKVLTIFLALPLLAALHRIRPWLVPAALGAMAALYLPILVNNVRLLLWFAEN